MNTSENNQKKHEKSDQVDDLTRFLDEDFDTDDVDLFEFTSEEDSPLTELKSIVLSLDWEITDDTLQDLADEIDRLKSLDILEADKVSQVYLQGLSKIGHYIQSEGARAHPNSIKLLLTLYYDFEKILSSETITGSEITALLKADVRKFKILQYQIAQRHGVEAPVPPTAEAKELGIAITDSEALRGLRAVILELDWEITDESLERLTEQLDSLKEKFSDDRYILVLVQGLSSLNSYISEEKGQAHPESFSLLHSFCEGLARLIEDGELDDEERQSIIVEQVNSLNNLKALIAGAASEGVEVLEEEAIETIEEEPADKITDEAPAFAAETEEELETFTDEAPGADGEIAPALAGDVGEGTEILEEEPPEELADKLESFFGGDETVAPPEPAPEPETAVAEEPVAPALDGEEELEEAAVFAEAETGEEAEIAPALSGDEGEGTEILEEEPTEELADKLEFFFGEDEKVAPPEPAPETEVAITEEPVAPALEGEEEFEEAPSLAEAETLEESDIAPALAGDDSEGTEILEEEPVEELAEKLESFFGSEEEVAPFEGAEPPPAAVEEAEGIAEAVEEPEESFEAEEEIVPALAGSPEDAGFGVEGELEEPPEGLDERLEGFFGDEEPAAVAEAELPSEEVTEETAPASEEPAEGFEAMFEDEGDIAPALSGDESEGTEILEEEPSEELADKLDTFFGEEEPAAVEHEVAEADDEMLLTPALAEEEDAGVNRMARPMKSEEEYQASVAQIRSHFQEQENELRQEIELLKEEIKNLRAQLGS